MERRLDDELKRLNDQILKMAALTEEAIHRAMEALRERSKDKALAVIDGDKRIDELENSVEKLSIEILALFQPMAIDLRFITTAMSVKGELERIGDLTVNICQRTLDLSGRNALNMVNDDIQKLSDISKSMVKNSIDAFVQRNEELAASVILSDKEANEMRSAIIDGLINDHIAKDTSSVTEAFPLILVTRDLERICDQAKSIAEDVIYMIQAKVVKHHPERLSAE